MADLHSKPTLRWGIIGVGTSATWLVRDLLLPRPSAKANHVIQAVGSNSGKGHEFSLKLGLPSTTSIYRSHEDVYADPDVDIVHIAVPHSLHLKECLEAFKAKKHVLCEKAFAMNVAEAREIFEAAKEAGVWVGEGLWTRAFPITKKLVEAIHSEGTIGRVQRVVADCGFQVDLGALPPENRYRDPALGAGSLLDLGLYLVNWALIAIEPSASKARVDAEDEGDDSVLPKILAIQTMDEVDKGVSVEVSTGMLMQFSGGEQAILSSTTVTTREGGMFCRIDGTKGHIEVSGIAPPLPTSFTVFRKKSKGANLSHEKEEEDEKTFKYDSPGGMGFYWEADEAALDIAAGRTHSSVMPWSQTVRVMRILDEVRKQGGG